MLHALSLSATIPRPGGSMSPFWDADTRTSMAHASIGTSAMPRLETASTITMASVPAVTWAYARTSWSTAYSGGRWWIIGRAMASSTSLGTGVGPGAISWYFFIGSRPPRRRGDRFQS